MADHLKTGLCTDALIMALQRHPPAPGLIHHRDRGVQGRFQRLSQRLDRGGCDDRAQAAFGAVWAGAVAITRSTTGGRARGAATVPGGDCRGQGE
jgi:putative transposase